MSHWRGSSTQSSPRFRAAYAECRSHCTLVFELWRLVIEPLYGLQLVIAQHLYCPLGTSPRRRCGAPWQFTIQYRKTYWQIYIKLNRYFYASQIRMCHYSVNHTALRRCTSLEGYKGKHQAEAGQAPTRQRAKN